MGKKIDPGNMNAMNARSLKFKILSLASPSHRITLNRVRETEERDREAHTTYSPASHGPRFPPCSAETPDSASLR